MSSGGAVKPVIGGNLQIEQETRQSLAPTASKCLRKHQVSAVHAQPVFVHLARSDLATGEVSDFANALRARSCACARLLLVLVARAA